MGSVTEKSWRVNVLGFNEFNLTKSEVSCLYSKNSVVDVQTLIGDSPVIRCEIPLDDRFFSLASLRSATSRLLAVPHIFS